MNTDHKIINNIFSFLEEKKAWKIVGLDLQKISSSSDYFIIANCLNKPHLKSLNEGLYLFLKKEKMSGIIKTGTPESGWIILDVNGIMIHLFDESVRDFYDLEGLWKDAVSINIKD